MRKATYRCYRRWIDRNMWTDIEASCLLAGFEPPKSDDHQTRAKIVASNPRRKLAEDVANMHLQGSSEKTASINNMDIEKDMGLVTDVWQHIPSEMISGNLKKRLPSPYVISLTEWIRWAEGENLEIPKLLRRAEKFSKSEGTDQTANVEPKDERDSLSILERRKLRLKDFINAKISDTDEISNYTQEKLWNKLHSFDPKIFPPLGKVSRGKFFSKQNLCETNGRGRPPNK